MTYSGLLALQPMPLLLLCHPTHTLFVLGVVTISLYWAIFDGLKGFVCFFGMALNLPGVFLMSGFALWIWRRDCHPYSLVSRVLGISGTHH